MSIRKYQHPLWGHRDPPISEHNTLKEIGSVAEYQSSWIKLRDLMDTTTIDQYTPTNVEYAFYLGQRVEQYEVNNQIPVQDTFYYYFSRAFERRYPDPSWYHRIKKQLMFFMEDVKLSLS